MKKKVQSKTTVNHLIALTRNDLQTSLVRIIFLADQFKDREELKEVIKARAYLNDALESVIMIQKIYKEMQEHAINR